MNDDRGFTFRSEMSISEGMKIEKDRLECTSGWGENIVDAKWWSTVDLAFGGGRCSPTALGAGSI
jgi:hypothetical protein